MGIYYAIEAVVGIILGILLAVRTKKAEGVTYGNLDRAGKTTNIILLVVYTLIAPLYLFIGALCEPVYGEGFLAVIGAILSIIASSAALICALGLGASVALRKKGKSKLSFVVQFAGIVGIGLMLLIVYLCDGYVSISIN